MTPPGAPTVSLPEGYQEVTAIWLLDGNQPRASTAGEVCSLVAAGEDPTVQTRDQSSGWVKASALGFVAAAPEGPPPPPESDTPPPPPALPSEESAIKEQLDALKAQREVQSSRVSQDLAAKIQGGV